MSYGDEETIESSNNCSIIIQNHIVGRFSNSSCKSMIGRPKVFLFQTCRGHEESNSVTVKSAETFTVPPDLDDLLMAFSTIPHYVAHRLMVGSPFIRIFCEVLREHSHKLDIQDMFKMVKNEMNKTDFYGNKVTYEVMTGLRKQLFFKPTVNIDLTTSNQSNCEHIFKKYCRIQ